MLRVALENHGFNVREATTVRSAIATLALERPDAAILDLGLPDGTGLDVIRSAREWTNIPIIVLTVTGDSESKVSALDEGADDFITKPFHVNELLARLRANLRRHSTVGTSSVVHTGALSIDLAAHVIKVHGAEVHLTATEYDILAELARHLGKVLTHSHLLRILRGPGNVDDISYLRVFIAQLRKKIEPNRSLPTYLHTEPGVGYRLMAITPINDATEIP